MVSFLKKYYFGNIPETHIITIIIGLLSDMNVEMDDISIWQNDFSLN